MVVIRPKSDWPHRILVIMLDMTEVERGMYRHATEGSVRLRQLCCHMQISEQDRNVFGNEKVRHLAFCYSMIDNNTPFQRTLTEMKHMMIKHTAHRIAVEKATLKDYRQTLAQLEAQLAPPDLTINGRKVREDRIKRAKELIQRQIGIIAVEESKK